MTGLLNKSRRLMWVLVFSVSVFWVEEGLGMPGKDLQFELEHGMVWKTQIDAEFWRGFIGTPFPEGPMVEDQEGASVDVIFAPEGRGILPLTAEEIDLVDWARVNLDRMSVSVLQGLLNVYPKLRSEYGYSEDELEEFMPVVTSTEDFKPLIKLMSINVHQVANDGVPYVGFVFDCLWDPEHGLGVLVHDQRVVEIGGVDTAILLWIAEKDAGLSANESE